ncbi:5'-nucleotidase [Halomonas sp. ML-15]|uniref:5'-nucleotidase, lipoprotein e(P4) family n=1 Tax=Halomonas sp. ML-15 TaxID=2773305 RepID=UPI001746FBCF|nr:HAD family acid phosphatase [Halomonas sp. ML-15]MBD3894632.1 5'-nucleotidase [Halomonas sp. ML-15]
MTSNNKPLVALLAALAATAYTANVSADGDADEATLCAQEAYKMGLRYQQQSAEIAALQRQGFALATLRLEQQIADHGDGANLAIITDLDETVIDNTELLVRDMNLCHDYTVWDTWLHWEREGTPRLIPGAMDFLEFADEQGVAIYYVSDRYEENKQDSLATLESLGLPQVADDTLLLLGPPKQERREFVEDNYTLVMQLGDTLHDFSEDFVSDVPLEEQHERVEEHAERFGFDWIVFPNATYGTWEDAELDEWDAPFETE